MFNYILRRLLLIPLTLFCIVIVNFVIINMAPGDPVTLTEISQEGTASRKENRSMAFGADERYLQFREHYGLTLPVLLNTGPWLSESYVRTTLWQLVNRKEEPESSQEMTVKNYDSLRVLFGDQSRFVMPWLMKVMEDTHEPLTIREMALRFFVRGGSRQAWLGPNLTVEQKAYNNKIAADNTFLNTILANVTENPEAFDSDVKKLRKWYEANTREYIFEPNTGQKISMLFFETRFFRYISRVTMLDFGTLRNDDNKTVISEVTRRFKYSLTLAIIPMFITFFLCQIFGFTMAFKQKQWPDYILNLGFLILYAIPIFVVAPFLIEKVALNHTFPFTDTPIPIYGFNSPDEIYDKETSLQRLYDVFQHIALPLIAIMYGSLAAEARLSRTAVLEVMRQDYVRTAWAKGVPPLTILFRHIGRNAAITIVTSLAGSLGVILGGSLIVETIFGINGFGKFFYDAVINRDYNVIMFSALAGSLLTLIGYLVADIAYTLLDPRLTLE